MVGSRKCDEMLFRDLDSGFERESILGNFSCSPGL